jgi:PBSX family phage terminase large subunit
LNPQHQQTVSPKPNYGWRVHDFAYRLLEDDARINILTGSVRSGKTWALHPKILRASDTDSPIAGWRVLVGQTKEMVYMNVLKDLFDWIGDANYHYSNHTGQLRIFDTEWKILGARDEGSEKFVRGSTIGIAVCDEVVLVPEGFFKMLLTRMSPAGARLYGSTNPDQPMHWLKTDYLDNKELIQKGDLFHLHMTMDDNPNLPPDYIEAQKRFYKGVFYQRFILGLWVMAEGTIWQDAWSDELIYDEAPIGLKNPGGHADRWISNDYGTSHPHVYLEFFDDGDKIWLDREYVWDSTEMMRQKTDGQYADDLREFMGANNGCQVIIPSEALSFRQECINRGIWVTEANNEVREGLQTVAGMTAARKLKVNRRCKRAIRGIQTYVWDPNKAKRGIEEPLKQTDDECDALRYGLHSKIYKWRYSG